MQDAGSAKIEYRAPIRLSDQLKLQFRCSFYFLRYVWAISAVIAVVVLSLNAMSLWEDPWSLLSPHISGLLAGQLIGPIILTVRRVFR
jgi:hypothetical protein